MIHVFKGLADSVGEHVIADVTQSGLAGTEIVGPKGEKMTKKKGGTRHDQHLICLVEQEIQKLFRI